MLPFASAAWEKGYALLQSYIQGTITAIASALISGFITARYDVPLIGSNAVLLGFILFGLMQGTVIAYERRNKFESFIRAALLWVVIGLFVSLLSMLVWMLLGYLVGFLARQSFSVYIQKGLFVCLLAGIVILSAFVAFSLWNYLVEVLFWEMRKYPPGAFTPEEWKAKIQKAKPAKQKMHLIRTDHHSVSLSATEFLLLLKEVDPSITREPALSTYWELLEQMDQALRQERHG